MISRMPFFNVSKIRELMRQGSPIYSYHRPSQAYQPHYEVARGGMDYHDIDPEENREDESQIEMRLPTINQKLNAFIQDIKADTESEFISNVGASAENSSNNPYTGLSGDSLAFTLVYVSVFTLTLLYVGIRLARRWRKKHRQAALQTTTLERITDDSMSSPGPLPPCGHAMCARAARGAPLLPYTWVNVHSLQHPPPHNTAACRGRCAACRSLAQPPPSYSKLFEEEAPPQYNDSLVIKDEDLEEAAPEYHDDIVIRLEEASSDTNSDVIINMEEDEEEKNVGQEELLTNEEERVSLNQDSSLISETDQSNS